MSVSKDVRVIFLLLFGLAGAAAAQPLLDCGVHGDIEIICGTRQPEDLELTPDGKFLIATQFLNQGRGGTAGGGMALFNLTTKTFIKMAETAERDPAWGDPACPGPIGDALVSHGESLLGRRLYVVNHGGRQSIEMYELRPSGGSWALVWRGCEVAVHEYNDVAVLPDGGFVGTYPGAGYVARWTPGKGESEVPGTRLRGPNGVVVSADGRFLYVNAFSAREVHKIELESGKEIGLAKVDFLPDNLTWTKAGKMLAAGVKGTRDLQGFGVAEIDPATMTVRSIFDSATHEPLISSVSVALEVGDFIYIGAFQGDRLVKIPYKK